MVRIDYSRAKDFITEEEIDAIAPEILAARDTLVNGSGEGNDFIGWLDLPENFDQEEYARIKAAAEKIRSDSDVLLVIGIGGSYLGARAAIEALCNPFESRVIFCGNNISAKYTQEIMDYIADKDFSINVISKSGTTTEPAIAFRIFRELLEKKYGAQEAAKRIYATTDKARGALKMLAEKNGYESFVVPDNVGGRYSVLTAVGLLPIGAAGVDLDEFVEGFRSERKTLAEGSRTEAGGEASAQSDIRGSAALLYAAVRNILYRKGKQIEILVDYEPCLHFVAEWWKQLYGESEGKDKKGIYPASVDFTTDLHSLGQFIQDGTRIMFETVLNVEKNGTSLTVPSDAENLDQLNYLAGRELDYVNKAAMEGTVQAHTDGGTPNIMINMEKLDAFNLGELFYMFEYACGVSGYTLGVNPFNQPGVEMYKKNMFTILGKPGYGN